MTDLTARRSESVTMEDLTQKQAAFVREYVQRGGRPGAGPDAAQAAGYAHGDRDAARVRAAELLRHPKVLAVMRDELTKKLNAAATLGVDVLVELASDKTVPPATRLAAARDLVDRGHMPIASRFAHAHLHAVRSIEDVLDMIEREDARGVVEADYSETE
jgi:hypothetical protein